MSYISYSSPPLLLSLPLQLQLPLQKLQINERVLQQLQATVQPTKASEIAGSSSRNWDNAKAAAVEVLMKTENDEYAREEILTQITMERSRRCVIV